MHNHNHKDKDKDKDNSANLNILVICSYCKNIMDVKSGGKEYTISHGCCDECYEKEAEKINKMKPNHSKKNT